MFANSGCTGKHLILDNLCYYREQVGYQSLSGVTFVPLYQNQTARNKTSQCGCMFAAPASTTEMRDTLFGQSRHNHNCSTKVLLHKRAGQAVYTRQELANGKNRNNSIKRYLITGHPYHSFLPPFSSILWRKETMNPPLFSFSLCTCSVKTV